jgi:hypothetical protein
VFAELFWELIRHCSLPVAFGVTAASLCENTKSQPSPGCGKDRLSISRTPTSNLTICCGVSKDGEILKIGEMLDNDYCITV